MSWFKELINFVIIHEIHNASKWVSFRMKVRVNVYMQLLLKIRHNV